MIQKRVRETDYGMRDRHTGKRRTGVGHRYLFRLFALAGVLLSCRPSMVTAEEVRPLELRPYRVHLLVAIDAPQYSPQYSPQFRRDLLEASGQAARRCLGSQWELEIAAADWIQPNSAEGLSRLTVPQICKRIEKDADAFDVWQAATIRHLGSGWRIDVRSWQPSVGVETETIGDETYDRLDVPLVLLRLCHSAFRPVGLVDDVDGTRVSVLLQAGALSVADESYSLSQRVKFLVPVLASRNRDRKIERLQQIPWTVLAANESRGARLACTLHSGLRSPIGGKQRGRVETLAIAVSPDTRSTLLELATQSKPSLPLVAHRIELRKTAEIPRQDEPVQDDDRLIKVLLTDRRGQTTITPDSTDTVIWLFAYSGRHLLARVPMVPGLSTRMRLEVPDDSARLEAESELYMLQGEVIEAVAARNTAAARVRAAIKKNDADRARIAVEELKSLPDTQVYLNRVISVRVPGVKAAKARKDRSGEARINRMCDEMVELIKQYLGEDKRQVVLEELKELLADEDAAEKPSTK